MLKKIQKELTYVLISGMIVPLFLYGVWLNICYLVRPNEYIVVSGLFLIWFVWLCTWFLKDEKRFDPEKK